MNYSETNTDAILSHHIESYWKLENNKDHSSIPMELLLPTCTFNIIFTHQTYWIKSSLLSEWKKVLPGVYFIGQTTTCLSIKSDLPISIIGVRFKPFAFSTLFDIPVFQLNEIVTPLSEIVSNPLINSFESRFLFDNSIANQRDEYLNELMYSLLSPSLSLDEKLRAQLNYIMDRQGNLKIKELTESFNTTKVTLRKHFINKIGLCPKKVCRIWRMNRILQLKEMNPSMNLTSLCLKAGFYDQAHFIRDFKSILGVPPKKFFATNTNLIKVSNLNISKRFTNQYDPRIN